eukprot:TRINITY_DN7420_c0_g1_i1.p1 TRINITY_DN7420_c0_g1~~TRINITY_DN7420_c0_g1_i1.p1  ORF type:complete len:244 (-),score=36.65 TRINITY_DN7420_c0_g1_i1:6-737(-)
MVSMPKSFESKKGSDAVVQTKRSAVKECISMVYHGFLITHLDSFAHFSYKGKMYNGKSSDLCTSSQGCTWNGVEALRDGICSRAILIDIPLLKDVEWLKPGESVTFQDILDFENKFDVRITSGDILLVRTGFCLRRCKEGPFDYHKAGVPSLHPDCMPLLRERDIALCGSDTPNDAYPPLCSIRNPVHLLALVAMGLPLMDNMDLERLSQECQRSNRWAFMLTVAPLELQGSSGSPVNPIALF